MNPENQPGPDDQTATAQPEPAVWGAPPPPPEQRARWSVRRTVVAVAIAVGIAAAGGAAIYAASGSVTGGGLGGGPGGGPGMIIGGPMTEIQHGEFQNGEVTAISDTSITVESEDGYERTYTVDDDTELGDIETGDDVMIMATVEGETATAVTVTEQDAMPKRLDGSRDGDGGPPRRGGDGN